VLASFQKLKEFPDWVDHPDENLEANRGICIDMTLGKAPRQPEASMVS
jgi:hypothetical protein